MGKNERGWILIDALIGMVIVAIALTALAVAYRQATVVTVSANNQATAVWVAQQMVETIKQKDATTYDPTFTNLPATVTVPPNPTVFSIAAVEQPADTNIHSSMRDYVRPVKITVQWTEAGGTFSVDVISYYYFKEL
jgi:Tfp pilus assembly protein PilV